MSVGRRNLLERIARSRMARGARRAGRHVAESWMVLTIAVGTWVIIVTGFSWLFGR